jgi:hypothetical protein
MILTSLPSTDKVAFDAAGARNTPQLGVEVLSHHPKEPMFPLLFVRFVQIHPVGHKYAAR